MHLPHRIKILTKKLTNLKGICTRPVHSSTIYNSQDMEATQVPINGRMDKEIVRYIVIHIDIIQPSKRIKSCHLWQHGWISRALCWVKEVRQRKTNTVWSLLYVKSNNNDNNNKLIDTENRLVVARGGGEWWEKCVKEIKKLKKSKDRAFNIYANPKFCLSKILH